MRSVSLSNSLVQEKIASSFVPLKVQIEYGSGTFPLDWPAVSGWRAGYFLMGGSKNTGFTGCCVISPDLRTELASTGSAFVWELFEAIAYDPVKFAAMLDKSLARFEREEVIRRDSSLGERQRRQMLAAHHQKVRREIRQEVRFHLPPQGFTAERARELFRLSGHLPAGKHGDAGK